MKKINFNLKKIKKSKLSKIFGGAEIETTWLKSNGEEVCDTWHDNDDDGSVSEGDCFTIGC